jgi:hypothetical protein
MTLHSNDGKYSWVKFTYKNTKAGIADRIHNAKRLRLPSLSYFIIFKEFDQKRNNIEILLHIFTEKMEH